MSTDNIFNELRTKAQAEQSKQLSEQQRAAEIGRRFNLDTDILVERFGPNTIGEGRCPTCGAKRGGQS